ncbi:MFS transporter [Pleionea sp. CnH1-48]|uniref:MFS transporter n=1 Tax=Pleionea sp. CnH1-48 TaxID=2954494 RepID=UPI00209797DF|nr:MFS transporter [Pleionea sp. CnH1-48]MCO7224351.1 MFS transporter [Pleionea sp. CnH1-48]
MNKYLPEKLQPMLLPIKLDSLGLFFINFLIPIVAHKNFEANGWQMGLLFSLQAIGTGCSALLFSKKVNRWTHRSHLILLGSIVKAVAYVLLYLAIINTQYELMVAATFCLGFGSGIFWLVWQTCFAQLSDFKHRAEIFGEASRQMGLGVMFGSIAAFTLLSLAEDYNQPEWIGYMVILAFSVSSSIAAVLSFKAVSAMSSQDAQEEKEIPVPIKMTTIAIFLFGMIFVGQLSGSLVAPFLEVYLLDHLKITSIEDLSIAYIPGGIISMIVAPKLGRFADNINPALFLGGASIIGATTTYVMLQVTSIWHISALFVIDASVITSAGLVLAKLISEVAGENKGTAFGLQGFVSNFGAISGPLIGGFFWQTQGATGPLMFSIFTEVFLAFCCIAILLPALLRSKHFAELQRSSSGS